MSEEPFLSATPNPVPRSETAGATFVSWSTGNGGRGVVAVSTDGGRMVQFGEGAAGTVEAPWIQPGHRYEFTLIDSDAAEILATLEVEMAAPPRPAPPTFLRVHPNPVPRSEGAGAAAVSWSAGGSERAVVTVSIDGAGRARLARGSSGTVMTPPIVPGRRYEFALHARRPSDPPLAAVTVAMADAASSRPGAPERPFIAASPNPVPSRGGGPGTALVSWSTAGRGPGLVTVSTTNGTGEQPFHDGAEGDAEAVWIQPGSVYLFRLYAGPGMQERLGAVTVMTAMPLRERLLDVAVLAGAGAAVGTAVAVPVLLAARLARLVRRR